MRRPRPNLTRKDEMDPENLLSTIWSEIEERLDALRPLLAEHEQLVGALSALDANTGSPGQDVSAPVRTSAAGSARTPRSAAGTRRVAPARRSSSRTGKTAGAHASKGSKQKRAPRGAAREAILAALEHGSHTVSELVGVTAMTGPNVNGNLRRLLAEGAIAKTDREGKTAYALSE
jgi:DNA-binding transcriptional ArsR family regulator